MGKRGIFVFCRHELRPLKNDKTADITLPQKNMVQNTRRNSPRKTKYKKATHQTKQSTLHQLHSCAAIFATIASSRLPAANSSCTTL